MRGNRLFKFIDRYLGISLCFILGKISKIIPQSLLTEYQPTNILVVKLSAMGDTVLLIPSLREIKRKLPTSKITMVVTEINRAIVEDCPYIDELILFDIKGCLKNPLKFVSFVRILRKKKFSLSFDFDQWTRISPLICYFSGAKRRIGFRTKGQGKHYLYTDVISHSRDKHEVLCFLDLVEKITGEVSDTRLELNISKDAGQNAATFLKENNISAKDLIVIIHPGCGKHGLPRQWAPEKFARLADELVSKHQVKIILTGGRDEIDLVKKIAKLMKHTPVIAANKIPLKELIALITKAKILISGNTGVVHIAAAVQTPTVVLHGPTNPVKWGPWGKGHLIIRKELPCSPCLYLGFEYGCKDYQCMKMIEVEDVLSAVEKQLQK